MITSDKRAIRRATGEAVCFRGQHRTPVLSSGIRRPVPISPRPWPQQARAFPACWRGTAAKVDAAHEKFDPRLNGELGVESDCITYLNQGVAIDYTIIAPSNMAVFSPSIPLMDTPFLFRDLEHWNAVLSSDALQPLEEELREKAGIVIVVLVLILMFSILFAVYGIEYAQFGGNQRSVLMRANLMVTYISVPIAGTVWTIFAGCRLAQVILNYRIARRSAA